MSDRLLFTDFLLEMIVGDDLDKVGADDVGRRMLRLLRLVPFDRGWATPAGPRGSRPPAVALRPRALRGIFGDFSLQRFLQHVSAFCYWVFFLPAKTWPISGIAASNKFFPMCLLTGRMYLRTTGMATLPIRIANAPKPPAPAPICRAGPQNVALCWAIGWLWLFI